MFIKRNIILAVLLVSSSFFISGCLDSKWCCKKNCNKEESLNTKSEIVILEESVLPAEENNK